MSDEYDNKYLTRERLSEKIVLKEKTTGLNAFNAFGGSAIMFFPLFFLGEAGQSFLSLPAMLLYVILGLSVLMIIFGIGSSFIQAEKEDALMRRLKRFVRCQMGISVAAQNNERSLINAITGCNHWKYYGFYRDENNNCLECKETYQKNVNTEMHEYIEDKLEQAVTEVEAEEKAKAPKARALKHSEREKLTEAFENPKKVRQLKGVNALAQARQELDDQDQDFFDRRTSTSGEITLSQALSDEWEHEFNALTGGDVNSAKSSRVSSAMSTLPTAETFKPTVYYDRLRPGSGLVKPHKPGRFS